MDIRIMEYYLAVTREGNISGAAEALHVSQPALSRQMKDLEEELGVTLFERGSRRIRLTEEGMILRKRAEEMVHLMQMTQSEISGVHEHLRGEVHIGAGESKAFHYLSRAAGEMGKEHPDVRFHVASGDTRDLMGQLENGLIDCALIFTEFDRTVYQALTLPEEDRFGVLLRKDHRLVQKEQLTIRDLRGEPVFISRASEDMVRGDSSLSDLKIAGTYNLIYNASLLVEDGAGLALGFEGLVNTTGDSPLTFRPLTPAIRTVGSVIWKKYQVLTPAVQMFLNRLKEQIS